jgi:hypothetical protein
MRKRYSSRHSELVQRIYPVVIIVQHHKNFIPEHLNQTSRLYSHEIEKPPTRQIMFVKQQTPNSH